MKKILCLLLCFFILFSFACVPSYAVEDNGFYVDDMTHKAIILKNVDNVLKPFDYTDHLTVVNDYTYLSRDCSVFTLSPSTDNGIRYVSLYKIENLNASHEYYMKFSVSSNKIQSNVCMVTLVFYNDDEILREQELGGCSFTDYKWNDVEFSFVPDTSGLGGYSTRLEFTFMNTGDNNSTTIYRMADFIEFVDKDDNTSWFQKIINAIKELPGNFVNGVKAFFDNLGDKFESVGNSITNKFEEVKNAIGQWFIDIGDKLSAKFQEVGNAISSKFQEIGDEFSARFEKFKPRIYEVFNWRYGDFSNNGEVIYDDDFYHQAIISNSFFVPSGSKYIFDISSNSYIDLSRYCEFFVDIVFLKDGNLLWYYSGTLDDFFIYYPSGFELPSGYSYYFLLRQDLTYDLESELNGISLSDFCNSVVQVYADEGWLTAMVQSILSGLKTLFLPTGEFFENKLNELNVFFDEKFGLFAFPFTLFVKIVSMYNNVGEGSGILHLNDFKINGNVFLSAQDINLKALIINFSNELQNESGINILELYYAFVDVIILIAFVTLSKNKYNKMLGTGEFSRPRDILDDKASQQKSFTGSGEN